MEVIENRPFYRKLYTDMIRDRYPEKEMLCSGFMEKEIWTALDVIEVNALLFGKTKKEADTRVDQKHRAYDKESIKRILRYQQINKLNNIQLANKYGLSRNTIAKWKKQFPEYCE